MLDDSKDATANEPLTREERLLLDKVPAALESGIELLEWWRKTDAADSYEHRYDETRTFNRPEDKSYGFFDTVQLSSGPQRINGNVQDMFYDAPKASPAAEDSAAEWINRQMQQFVLRYFMRISDFRQPEQAPEPHEPPPPGLGFLSQCRTDVQNLGFGFSQLYYKRCNGEIGRFRESRRNAIIDLRRLGDEYQWIVLKNPIFNFKFNLAPLGNQAPQLVLPLVVSNYLVMSRAFVIDESPAQEGILGRYGFGYALIKDPLPSALGYGPGELEPACEQLIWEVHETGEITSRAIFVANEPTKMLNLSVDPLAWAFQIGYAFGTPSIRKTMMPLRRFYNSLPWSRLRFDPVFPSLRLLNLVTFDQASERLCISVEQVKKFFLYLHFKQHYDTILGSLQTWRQIPDWLAPEQQLPAFVRDGRSA